MANKNTNTGLSIKLDGIAPKPTKTQVIEALVERERELWKEQRALINARIEPLNKELNAECFHLMSIAEKDEFKISMRDYNNDEHCSASIKLRSQKLTKIINKIEKINDEAPTWFNDDKAKDVIKEAMAAPKAVNPLLGNADVKDALDTILNQIKAKPVQALSHDVEVLTD